MMLNHDLKKEFQVERIAFFSDAVFAIAITLLIIEIKVPEVHGERFSSAEIVQGLFALIPKFIGFIVSFFVIALYWVNHHQIFKYVVHYSPKLVWTNLFLLFSIVMMPFSSAFYSDYWLSYSAVPLGFYVVNICLTGFMNTRLWYVVSNPANKLSEGLTNRAFVSYCKARSMIAPFVFLLSFLVSTFSMRIAYWCPGLIFVFMMFLKRYYRKKHPELFIK
ncbi:TMEM175 family protein [Mucilaginibacter gilvus]|uniref:DUF1211 domain-containing protein n=1 Tax=Mucilaginibacter gilvus TaxID=2305909 RepID=A0A444MP97_9SPHI|nr:TMEM175 family protein [Mucilaginibacter gilvus]RWY52435.1 DUF1211 domain-containing protein [Mucilaginibacter gilvus]